MRMHVQPAGCAIRTKTLKGCVWSEDLPVLAAVSWTSKFGITYHDNTVRGYSNGCGSESTQKQDKFKNLGVSWWDVG